MQADLPLRLLPVLLRLLLTRAGGQALVVLWLLVACSPEPPGPSVALSGAIDSGGLPIDPAFGGETPPGVTAGCATVLIRDPLRGRIAIDLSSADRVALVLPDGSLMRLRWPVGFRLVANPFPRVVAPEGDASWGDGDQIEFPSIARGPAVAAAAEGSVTVRGWIGGRYCYGPSWPRPSSGPVLTTP